MTILTMDDFTILWAALLVLAPMALVHCPSMCGPLMIAFRFGRISDQTAPTPRLAVSELLIYQSGRAMMYLIGGAGAGWLGERWVLNFAQGTMWISIILAIFFLGAALHKLGWIHWQSSLNRWIDGLVQRVTQGALRMFPQRRWLSIFALGVGMAFLPCGLALYALALAADSANPVMGALIMGLLIILSTPILAPIAALPTFGFTRFRLLQRYERWIVAGSLIGAAALILWLGFVRSQSGHCPWCPPSSL